METQRPSLIVPARNEGGHLRAFLSELSSLSGHLHEIVLVLDGCDDDSEIIAGDTRAHWPREAPLVVEILVKSRGKAGAVRAGLEAARSRYALLWDADLEYGLASLPGVVACAAPGTLVSGWRPTGRCWKSLLAGALVRMALARHGRPPRDVLTGVHLAERAWLLRVLDSAQPGGYALEAAIVRAALQDNLHLRDERVAYRCRGIAEGRGVRWHHLWSILRAAA